jgi:hypothetical protein
MEPVAIVGAGADRRPSGCDEHPLDLGEVVVPLCGRRPSVVLKPPEQPHELVHLTGNATLFWMELTAGLIGVV